MTPGFASLYVFSSGKLNGEIYDDLLWILSKHSAHHWMLAGGNVQVSIFKLPLNLQLPLLFHWCRNVHWKALLVMVMFECIR